MQVHRRIFTRGTIIAVSNAQFYSRNEHIVRFRCTAHTQLNTRPTDTSAREELQRLDNAVRVREENVRRFYSTFLAIEVARKRLR